MPYAEFSDPQSLNLYTYVRNIPTAKVDLDGHDGGTVVLDVVEAVAEDTVIVIDATPLVAVLIIDKLVHAPSVGQSNADEKAAIQQGSQERAAQNGGVDPQAESGPAAAGAAPPMKGNGRGGKQNRLKELGQDQKVSSADRGEIKRDQNEISKGKRSNIRVPGNKQLAHRRGKEARKGYNYKHADLQDKDLHKLQHKHEGYK